jgi:spermidine/putrescine transport system permease protein
MWSLRQHLGASLRVHPGKYSAILLAPALVWCLVCTLIPLGILAVYSVMSRGPWGTVLYTFTLENYRQVADPVFLRLLLRSLRLALLTTGICLVLGYGLAYWIAFYGGRHKSLYSLLVILPFWTSDLVRLYAWMTLLADHGVVPQLLRTLGIPLPFPLLYTEGAVLLGLVYTYLPFMVLPLYAALERLDPALLEAAADLGAAPRVGFTRVTLPLTRGGILSGIVLVFVPSLGEIVVPELLGGAKTLLLGQFIALKFTGLRHWPLGAAYTLVLVAILGLLVVLALRVGDSRAAFQARDVS